VPTQLELLQFQATTIEFVPADVGAANAVGEHAGDQRARLAVGAMQGIDQLIRTAERLRPLAPDDVDPAA
jgi:hypothetical protein